jgi:hypothetical protein
VRRLVVSVSIPSPTTDPWTTPVVPLTRPQVEPDDSDFDDPFEFSQEDLDIDADFAAAREFG